MVFRSLLVTLSVAAASIAASLPRVTFPPANAKIVDVSYKAVANGTAPLAEIPASARSHDLQKRDAGNVYMCTAANWQQYCVYITDASPGECVNLAADLNDLVSSFGPDPNQECYMYSGFDCSETFAGPIVAPGFSGLSQPLVFTNGLSLPSYNDVMSSYV
ncbi:hypothetical protein FB451DRAFT_1181914 [Mycena latifolia]|nr:hypothetical protein FB451DRAFT_1181914 [Mycena latifolia]